jgi:hypothetical protein
MAGAQQLNLWQLGAAGNMPQANLALMMQQQGGNAAAQQQQQQQAPSTGQGPSAG